MSCNKLELFPHYSPVDTFCCQFNPSPSPKTHTDTHRVFHINHLCLLCILTIGKLGKQGVNTVHPHAHLNLICRQQSGKVMVDKEGAQSCRKNVTIVLGHHSNGMCFPSGLVVKLHMGVAAKETIRPPLNPLIFIPLLQRHVFSADAFLRSRDLA